MTLVYQFLHRPHVKQRHVYIHTSHLLFHADFREKRRAGLYACYAFMMTTNRQKIERGWENAMVVAPSLPAFRLRSVALGTQARPLAIADDSISTTTHTHTHATTYYYTTTDNTPPGVATHHLIVASLGFLVEVTSERHLRLEQR
jgi:hypothetical protein